MNVEIVLSGTMEQVQKAVNSAVKHGVLGPKTLVRLTFEFDVDAEKLGDLPIFTRIEKKMPDVGSNPTVKKLQDPEVEQKVAVLRGEVLEALARLENMDVE